MKRSEFIKTLGATAVITVAGKQFLNGNLNDEIGNSAMASQAQDSDLDNWGQNPSNNLPEVDFSLCDLKKCFIIDPLTGDTFLKIAP